MYECISGMLTMAYAVAGLFFLKYWRGTRDRLFGWLSAAFWILAGQRLALIMAHPRVQAGTEEQSLVFYIFRLLAFVLILVAIIDKNRARPLS